MHSYFITHEFLFAIHFSFVRCDKLWKRYFIILITKTNKPTFSNRKNLIRVKVFYEELNYEFIQEVPVYSVSIALSQILIICAGSGGQRGAVAPPKIWGGGGAKRVFAPPPHVPPMIGKKLIKDKNAQYRPFSWIKCDNFIKKLRNFRP